MTGPTSVTPFAPYAPFEAEFQDRFGPLIRRFPRAVAVLEGELRNELIGDVMIARDNLSRRRDRFAPLEWLARLAARRRCPSPQVYIELPGFHDLRQALATRFAARDIPVFSNRKTLGRGANKILHKLATMGPAYSEAVRISSERGAIHAAADEALMMRLERSLARNEALLRAAVERQNIKLFLASGDSQPFSRMLCRVARSLGLPYIVLAHGYVSEPRLVTIAPLHGDQLILWTELQRRQIAAAVPERAQDLLCFGYPLRPRRLAPASGNRRVLFAWEPIRRLPDPGPHVAALGSLAEACRKAGYAAAFRPHPKERGDADIRRTVEGLGMAWDTADLSSSLDAASLVASSNSTVLTEAAVAGRPAVQIAELAVFGFEGAPAVRVADFAPDRLMQGWTPPALPLVDVDALFAFLAGRMAA